MSLHYIVCVFDEAGRRGCLRGIEWKFAFFDFCAKIGRFLTHFESWGGSGRCL